MTRIAVFGWGPLRWEPSTNLFALALRTWHFAARTFAQHRHAVSLIALRRDATDHWPVDTALAARAMNANFH